MSKNVSNEVNDTNDIGRSQSPSVSSHSYAIPITDDMASELSENISSSSSNNSDNDDEGESLHALNHELEDNEDDSEIASQELNDLLQNVVPESAGNATDTTKTSAGNNGPLLNSQGSDPMFDVSKYIFESLTQAVESIDFSEAFQSQTKTSAVINSKSLELRQLLNMTKKQLNHFQERFENGVVVSNRIKRNIIDARRKINKFNDELRTQYPIEFNQAREKIIDRQLDQDDDSGENSH
ncbi:Kxd1p NDAI_0I01160 [Naumovozyma dairenensis CBS 421]|uniref:Biogenesis of lysosome-related organelles complex 1 subunit KXD1 n=1 Tax=Naumovozyma dairenensis (strain ATCC 10597 / BCRC 20456 / CBS 421 / NBRC 0211 / NRRL Y-12639) TaxID=1071378 RepID=G0WFX4_NAUDC|nr:hypothetical protein NDAI_0I01160 [Naumovozyma dairenensis CBS 421]CCD26685.1 hypothetical protein NDAI_0I01160 [Naumovozyma dairenensis CBS 421]